MLAGFYTAEGEISPDGLKEYMRGYTARFGKNAIISKSRYSEFSLKGGSSVETTNQKVPLSQTQLGIYLECERLGDGAYNRQYLYTLDKSLDMERLARAVEKTIQAHPYMEVRISNSNTDTPTQFIPYTEPYQQTVMKLSESEWQKTLQSLIAEPLKLIGGRLFRFDLVETECAKYMLRTTHNIAFDGMSYNIIMRDIAAAYNGEELTQETYNALDIACEESQLRVSTEYQHAKEWYEKNFSGLDVESLPEPDKNDSDSYDVFVHPLPLNESDIKEFCRAKNISTSALTSAAFALLIGTYTNHHEALFPTIYHGRKKILCALSECSSKRFPFMPNGTAI